MPPDFTSDEDLVRRYLNGDSDAESAIFHIYWERVWKIASRILRTAEDADDAAQEVFERLFRYRGAFDPTKGSLSAYLSTVARNRAIEMRNSKYREHCRPLPKELLEILSAATSREDDPAFLEEVRAQIPACCDARGRQIMDLIFENPGIRNKEIALRLAMTETNVSSYLCNIRKCLRKRLGKIQH